MRSIVRSIMIWGYEDEDEEYEEEDEDEVSGKT